MRGVMLELTPENTMIVRLRRRNRKRVMRESQAERIAWTDAARPGLHEEGF